MTADDIGRLVAGERDHSVPALRKLRREVSRQLRTRSGPEVLSLVQDLASPDSWVPRWFAYEIALHHQAAMAGLSEKYLERLGMSLASWGDVDAFACYLLGPAWREGLVSDRSIHERARSRDRWRRRAALVSTVALNSSARGGTGDPKRTLAVCDLVRQDRDDMVVKALSWALRELAKKEPQLVDRYLRANEQQLAPRVLREVRNKLATGRKNPKPISRK